jgi:hypothetical protein
MRVDAERDCRVCMTKSFRDDVNRHPGQQKQGGVNVPQVVRAP